MNSVKARTAGESSRRLGNIRLTSTDGRLHPGRSRTKRPSAIGNRQSAIGNRGGAKVSRDNPKVRAARHKPVDGQSFIDGHSWVQGRSGVLAFPGEHPWAGPPVGAGHFYDIVVFELINGVGRATPLNIACASGKITPRGAQPNGDEARVVKRPPAHGQAHLPSQITLQLSAKLTTADCSEIMHSDPRSNGATLAFPLRVEPML